MKAQGYLIFGLLFAIVIAVFAVVNGNDVKLAAYNGRSFLSF